MKFTAITLASILAVALAAPGPNAQRMSRGLPPLRPKSFPGSGVDTAKRGSPSGSGQCNTGITECCTHVGAAGSSAISVLLALLGVVIGDATLIVGLGCSPLTLGGVGSGSTCNAEPVCCQNNQFNGLVAVGCSPININL